MIRALTGLVLSLVISSAFALTAKSYIVTEMDGTVLLEQNADDVRSIASITKLFTTREAFNGDLNEFIEIEKSDMKLGRMRSTPLKVGQKYTRVQLIELALISSDNVAAMALGRVDPVVSPLPVDTTIVEASGLDSQNQSTARSIAALARELVTSELAKTSVQPTVTIGKVEKRSTNPLITKPGWVFHLSKTGFINASGGCLVVVFESGGRLLTAVILGSRDVPARWRDLYELRQKFDTSEFAAPGSAPKAKRRRGR
jgi:D-alanyl-D-alanine endopeptidase (penicillin-binding protein 7)